MFALLKKNSIHIFVVVIGILYLYGVLSVEHYRMGNLDMYIGLKIAFLICISLFICYLSNKIERVGFSTVTWGALTLLIALQPAINDIIYIDSLIFAIGTLLIASLVSIVTLKIKDENYHVITKGIAWVGLTAGILTVVIQFLQLFYPNYTFSFVFHINGRLYGNIAQPNQAGFIITLSIVSAIYLAYVNIKNKALLMLLGCLILFLSIGVAFSISRTAIILLFVSIIGSLFYKWPSHKVRWGIAVLVSIFCTIGYKIGTMLIFKFFTSYEGKDGFGRLVQDSIGLRPALYERALAAFSESPLTGVGYGNYLAFGLEGIERWRWFEHATHSHNIFTQIGAELGILGLLSLSGVLFVLCRQLYLFLTFRLSQERFFICLLLLMFALYSVSEFPLWYARLLFPFVFLVALIDDGFKLQNVKIQLNKMFALFSLMLASCALFYIIAYDNYLQKYEIITTANVSNQEMIDAYNAVPNIFGFSKFKEEMLHIVADEEMNNPHQLIAIGSRLIRSSGSLDVMRVQARLMMKLGQADEVHKIHKAICIVEYQQEILLHKEHKNCEYALMDLKRTDPKDEMGYVKRLNDWYVQRYLNK